jgi:glutathione S-transferase
MRGSLGQVEAACEARRGRWLVGDRMTQADITVTCVFALLSDTVLREGGAAAYPAIGALAARCEELPPFRETRTPFFVPSP